MKKLKTKISTDKCALQKWHSLYCTLKKGRFVLIYIQCQLQQLSIYMYLSLSNTCTRFQSNWLRLHYNRCWCWCCSVGPPFYQVIKAGIYFLTELPCVRPVSGNKIMSFKHNSDEVANVQVNQNSYFGNSFLTQSMFHKCWVCSRAKQCVPLTAP